MVLPELALAVPAAVGVYRFIYLEDILKVVFGLRCKFLALCRLDFFGYSFIWVLWCGD